MAELIASEVVENLATQFSSALDCYRELVQNAIDAGSPQVDVWMEFIPSKGHTGTITVHVDDFGEGMDEHIIDSQLTRLFASSKEDDLTKIGKFGIGFVSVFALNPRGVLVRTGRGGEYWEVFFDQDRSFIKTRLHAPVEGTQVTLFLEGDHHRYTELVAQSLATLKRWCCHSETEVTFEDRSAGPAQTFEVINSPFVVQGDCLTKVKHQGTEIVLAYRPRPGYGFYNRGLTLAFTEAPEEILGETRGRRFSRINLKIKSRYLEHTLSRETVLRDVNYDKAMTLLDAAASGPLASKLFDEIEQLVATDSWRLGEVSYYLRLVSHLASEPYTVLEDAAEKQLLRLVDGQGTSLESIRDAFNQDGRIFVAEAPSELTKNLSAQGVPVLLAPSPGEIPVSSANEEQGSYVEEALENLVTRYIVDRSRRGVWKKLASIVGFKPGTLDVPVVRPDEVYVPVQVDPAPLPDETPLVEQAARVLNKSNTGYRKLTTCQLNVPVLDPPLFVTSRRLGELMARPPEKVEEEEKRRRPEAAVNRQHPHFLELKELFEDAPALATYCLAKALLLNEDRLLNLDSDLMFSALGG